MTDTSKWDGAFAKQENEDKRVQSLTEYRLLGNTGLRVSPIAFGAGTFGEKWGDAWSTGKEQGREIFNRYVEAGGNFFDTSDVYQFGESELWLGEYIKDAGIRDRLVISTKATQNQAVNDPNGGGNGRKHIVESVNKSLERLGTDYIDLFYLHHWDQVTPVEEVVMTFDQLIKEGKIRHYGLSNFPAWYVSKAHTIAQQRFLNPVSAIQNQYSLVARSDDAEYLPMCKHLGIAYTAWSPLANGLLTGKYQVNAEGELTGAGRLTEAWATDPSVANLATKEKVAVIAELLRISKETGHTPSQIALNWMIKHRGVTTAVIGARKLEQLEINLKALEFDLDQAHVDALNEVSALTPQSPYSYHTPEFLELIHTGTTVKHV